VAKRNLNGWRQWARAKSKPFLAQKLGIGVGRRENGASMPVALILGERRRGGVQ